MGLSNTLFRPWSSDRSDLTFVKGRGPFLYDSHGRRYFDLTSGSFNVSLGYSNAAIISHINTQLRALPYLHPSFETSVRARLTRLLMNVSDNHFAGAYICCGGGEAVESAVAFARHVSKRRRLACFRDAYHGSLGVAAELSQGEQQTGAQSDVLYVDPPYCFRCPYGSRKETCNLDCADHLECAIKRHRTRICALVIEPLIGINGVIVIPERYLRAARDITNRHHVLLIYDEVLTGFYRTGRCFAYQDSDAPPDMLCIGKGMNSGYAPIGGVLISERIRSFVAERPMEFGSTNMGHPVSCAASLAAIGVLRRQSVQESIRRKAQALRAFCEDVKREFPGLIADVRGKGCLVALELGVGEGMGRLTERQMLALVGLLSRCGVLVDLDPTRSFVPIAPPLNASERETRLALEMVKEALVKFRIGLMLSRF